MFHGREGNVIRNIVFDHCSFTREAAPDAAPNELFRYAEGIEFNGTTFNTKELPKE